MYTSDQLNVIAVRYTFIEQIQGARFTPVSRGMGAQG